MDTSKVGLTHCNLGWSFRWVVRQSVVLLFLSLASPLAQAQQSKEPHTPTTFINGEETWIRRSSFLENDVVNHYGTGF